MDLVDVMLFRVGEMVERRCGESLLPQISLPELLRHEGHPLIFLSYAILLYLKLQKQLPVSRESN